MRYQLVERCVNLRVRLTQEERHHLRCCDALILKNMIRQPRKTWPYCRNHDLNNITAIDRLDRKPEHCQYHSGYYSHWHIP